MKQAMEQNDVTLTFQHAHELLQKAVRGDCEK